MNHCLPCSPTYVYLLENIPILHISLHGLLACEVWSSSASLHIIMPSYYPITNQWLFRPPLDMTVLDDVVQASYQLVPPYSVTYDIVPDMISCNIDGNELQLLDTC